MQPNEGNPINATQAKTTRGMKLGGSPLRWRPRDIGRNREVRQPESVGAGDRQRVEREGTPVPGASLWSLAPIHHHDERLDCSAWRLSKAMEAKSMAVNGCCILKK